MPEESRGGRREEGGGRGGYGRRDRRPPRKKICRFCAGKIGTVDIRDIGLLKGFLSERGRIVSRRTSGNCARHQRQVTRGIRRARHAALLPYSVV
jgi:small subunit ribosomal protein S18